MKFSNVITAIGIVSVVFGTIYLIVKKSLNHAENITRIKHGYPTIDGKFITKDEQ